MTMTSRRRHSVLSRSVELATLPHLGWLGVDLHSVADSDQVAEDSAEREVPP